MGLLPYNVRGGANEHSGMGGGVGANAHSTPVEFLLQI